MTDWKHDPLQEDLAGHLRGNTDRMVWTNTQLGPAGSPRPDVFTIDKSYARFACDAYEIKVSVADLRRDVTSGKWQSYLQFAHRVWFAFPRGMVPIDEVPRECGVILRSDAGWRAARKPIAKSLDTMPRNAWLKRLIECFQEDPQNAPRLRVATHWTMQQVIRQKLGDDAAGLFRKHNDARESYEAATVRMQTAADDIEAEIRRMRERAASQVQVEQQRLDGAMAQLGVALGIPAEEVTAAKLTEAIHELKHSLSVHHLTRLIERLQDLDRLLKSTRGEAA